MSLSKRPVTLEDILRLKRAERPPAEFWDQFDRELRAKQLAALVEKRPWWQSWPRVFSGFRRYHLPLGATAVLALTFISVHEYEPVTNEPAADPSREVAVATRAAAQVANTASVAVVAIQPIAEPDSSLNSAAENAVAADDAPATIASDTTSAAPELARMIPLLGSAALPQVAQAEATPSARAIAANFAAAHSDAGVSRRALLSAPPSFESRATPASVRTPVEPLAQITPPSESRRNRLLAAIATTTSYTDAPFRNGERLGTRVSQERLYDEVHRFGASGNSLSMKF